jgi:hypothetical protein
MHYARPRRGSPIPGRRRWSAEPLFRRCASRANLYESLAALKPGGAQRLRDYTLIAVGAQFVSGPGFILLTGTGATGEILLDSTCEAAGGGG